MKKFVLDAGHSPDSPGCHGHDLQEHIVVLDPGDRSNGMVQRVGHLLREKGHQTILTRDENDESMSIDERVEKAIKSKADMLLSFHCDANPKEVARGFTVIYARGDQQSRALAEQVCRAINEKIGGKMPCRGVMDDTRTHVKRLGLLRGLKGVMPAVLIECGFLTNEEDSKLLKDRPFRQELAQSVADIW